MARYFLRLGALGFGGPVALVAAMHQDLVVIRGWFTEQEYREGVTLAQVSPGPLAAQLCFYLGYLRGGWIGAALAGTAFVLPSLVMVILLGWAYVRYQGISEIRAVFYGVGAAVAGLITVAAGRLLRRSVGPDRLLAIVAAVAATATVLTGREPVILIIAAGMLVWLARTSPGWLASRSTLREAASLALLAATFVYAGAFVFGSGLAIIPFLRGELVLERGWLTESQFLDAVAVALITPGPVVITTGFIGFLVAGLPGALVAAAATFLPCFVITVALAPSMRRHGSSPGLSAAAAGVTAAAIGSLGGAVLLIGREVIVDPATAGLAGVAGLAALLPRRLPDAAIIFGAAGLGLWLA